MIRLGEPFRGLLYTPFYLAHALGALADEGLEVRLETAASPAQSAQDLLSGRFDVIWGGPMRVLHHYDRDPGCPIVLFAEAITRDPFFLVGREPNPTFRLENLLQCRLATVSEVPTPWLCLQEDLRRAGLDPDGLEREGGRPMADNVSALREGKVDVVQVFEPWVQSLVAEGAGHIWYAAADRGHTAYTSYYTTRPALAELADDLYRMTRALYRTERWLAESPVDQVAAKAAPWFPDLHRETLAGAIERYRSLGVWSTEPVLNREGYDRLKAGLLSGGWITRDTPYASCVDTILAERVIREGPPAPIRG